jgi:hypothetical protein
MAASDHLHPDQLKMFMSPREIAGYIDEFGDFGAEPKYIESGTAAKMAESRDSGMHDSIAAEGVKKPVEISHFSENYGDPKSRVRGKTILSQGHHRWASQNDADPDRLMPVVHHLNSWGGAGAGRYLNLGTSGYMDPTGDDPIKHPAKKKEQ